MKNKTAFLPIHVSVFNCGVPYKLIGFGKAIYLLPVPIGSLLFVLQASTVTLGGSAQGVMACPPCCLATGRWGVAAAGLTQRYCKGPCSLSPAWSYEESTGWHDENKVIITETPNVTMSWTRMIGHCCTMISLKSVHSCNGHFHFWTNKQCKEWFGPRVGLHQESTSYHTRKKSFFVP